MLRQTPGSIAVSKFDDDMLPTAADDERWWDVRPPLDELRAEITPRISLHDMLSETQRDNGAVVVDVRPKEQFHAVRFPRSFHFNTHKLVCAALF